MLAQRTRNPALVSEVDGLVEDWRAKGQKDRRTMVPDPYLLVCGAVRRDT